MAYIRTLVHAEEKTKIRVVKDLPNNRYWYIHISSLKVEEWRDVQAE